MPDDRVPCPRCRHANPAAVKFCGQAIRNPTQLWKAHAALARLHAVQGKPAEAAVAVVAARAVLSSVREGVQDPELRGSLATLMARVETR